METPPKNGEKERMEKVDLLFNILVDITDMLNKSGLNQPFQLAHISEEINKYHFAQV